MSTTPPGNDPPPAWRTLPPPHIPPPPIVLPRLAHFDGRPTVPDPSLWDQRTPAEKERARIEAFGSGPRGHGLGPIRKGE